MKTILLGIGGGAGFVALVGAILFGSAGRWDLPMFWAYLGVWAASIVAAVFVVDPTLRPKTDRIELLPCWPSHPSGS